MAEATYYMIFCGIAITILKEVNTLVDEPYMDEPFHVPQAQLYCEGKYTQWDPKITTPPGLYVMSLILKKLFMFKCTLPMLRLSVNLFLLALPLVLTRLLCYHQRVRPPSTLVVPTTEAIILSAFPIAWFFGFMYYTELPSLVFVVLTVTTASQGQHWFAALLGLISCTFRQTNIIWVLYAFASSQLMYLRFRKVPPSAKAFKKLHDPAALEASPGDLLQSVLTVPNVILDILPSAVPYALVLALFSGFVVWNGGIVLGDKSNHIPSLHIPQVYYFAAFSTVFGWPVLISGSGGAIGLSKTVLQRMFGSPRRTLATALVCLLMCGSVYKFTIHHPFLLSDNRHYTFYLWRRVYMLHVAVPYLLVPIYLACGWAWYLRAGVDQTILQNLLLPLFLLPTLLPTPLLEPRYFLIPYVLLRSQIPDVPGLSLLLECLWYTLVNAGTMYMYLYKERDGVGRFMW